MSADDHPGRRTTEDLDTEITSKSRLWMKAVFAGHQDEVEYLVIEVERLRCIRRRQLEQEGP